jgi:hypothetical protein
MSLADYLEELESSQEEMTKQAAEEEAAGRIMARGFMDELNKLAALPAEKPRVKIKPESIVTPTKGGSREFFPRSGGMIFRDESVADVAKKQGFKPPKR